MSVKLLNLDDLNIVKREVELAGVAYPLMEQTVGQMINALKLADEAQKAGEIEDEVERSRIIIGQMIETAARIIPTCPEPTLQSMNMKQLAALLEFAAAPDEEVIDVAEPVEGEETVDEGKKKP